MKLPLTDAARNWSDRLYAAAFAVCKNPQDAEDVLQETLLAYHLSDREFESEAHVKAWLLRVAINKAKNAAMCFWRRNRAQLEDYADTLCFETPGDRSLFEAVMRLPERYRVAVHLFYYEDYSVREISRLLGTGESTIKSRLCRARKMLKRQLTEEWEDE